MAGSSTSFYKVDYNDFSSTDDILSEKEIECDPALGVQAHEACLRRNALKNYNKKYNEYLATPRQIYEKDDISETSNITKAALVYKASPHIKKLAIPRPKPPQEMIPPRVPPAALTYKATKRIKELSQPKVKVAAPKSTVKIKDPFSSARVRLSVLYLPKMPNRRNKEEKSNKLKKKKLVATKKPKKNTDKEIHSKKSSDSSSDTSTSYDIMFPGMSTVSFKIPKKRI